MADNVSIPIGTRVAISGKPELGIGTVKYCGMTKFSPGRWVGIELDTPNGKNDGVVQGERYFECKPLHGLFVKPPMAIIQESSPTTPSIDLTDAPLPVPTPSVTTPSKVAASSGIRPPSSTGIRPPSSLGKGRPSLTGSSSTPTPTTSAVKKPAGESGLRRPSTIPSTSDKTSTSPSQNTTSPPPEKIDDTTIQPSPQIESPTSTTTTTTTTTAPPPQPQQTPSKIPRPPSSSSSRPSLIPKPAATSNTIEQPPQQTQQKQPDQPISTQPQPSPSPPTSLATPSSEKKKSKIVQGEDEEEEEEINDLLNKSLATEKQNSAAQANIEKMMNSINELTEFKIKSTEEIDSLKEKLKDTATNKDKQIKELEKQIQQLEKTISSKEKENENLLKNQHKNEEQNETSKNKEKIEFEKEKQNLLEQINQLNENLELLTLDKEVTEEKLEFTTLECEEVKDELELMKIEFETMKFRLQEERPNRSVDENLPTDVIVLQEQNEKLKEALVKLRDITMNDKHEMSKKSKELESITKQFMALNDKSNRLEQELAAKVEEVIELKQALEDAENSESLVTDLSERNLELSEEVEDLKATVADLESFRDLSEELSDNQAALEKSLRLEVNSKDIEILNLNGQLANLQIKSQENDKTIMQFRDLVGRLQHKLEELRRKEEEQSEQNSSWSAIQQQLLSKNIQLQNQVIKATALEIDHQLEKNKSVESQVHLSFVYEYLPEQTFQSDNDAISMLLLLKRVILKSELAQRYLNRTYKVEEIGNKVSDSTDETLTSNQVAHSLQIIHILEHLAISATWLTETLERCQADQWLRSGRSVKDMRNQERILDHLLDLIKQERFGSSYNGQDLEKICQRLDSLLLNIFGDKESNIFKPEWSILLNYILGIQYNIKQIMLNDINIVSVTNSNQNIFPHKEMSTVLSVCRKVVKNLLTKPYLSQSSIVRDLLKSSEHTCKSILIEIIQVLPKIEEDPTNSAIIEDLNIRVQAKCDLLVSQNQNNDEIEIDGHHDEEESKLSSSLEKVFYRMNIQLSDVVESIIAGDLNLSEKDKAALEKTHPWTERANQLKQSLGEVGQLRDIISTKDQELLDNLKTIKAKEAELIEEKRKEESFDKRIRILQKSENEVTEKLQKEIKSREENEKTFRQALAQLRNEKNSLEHDSKLLQHKIISLQAELQKKANAPASPSALANQELLRSVDDIQILSLKKSIRFLRNENLKLKSQKSIKELQELKLIENYNNKLLSLNSNNKPSSVSSTPGASSPQPVTSSSSLSSQQILEQQSKKQQIKFNEIVEYSKQVNHMMVNILESTAAPKVLDLSAKYNNQSSIEKTNANEIENQKLLLKQQERKVKQLQSKITSFISSSSSQFGLNNYADANQSRMLKESIPHKIASITIPTLDTNNNINNTTNNNNINSLMLDKDIQQALNSTILPNPILFTNNQTFKNIHQVFVK
ncbi:hypothetical protein DICPUDRAFT_94545 [Dictyostelium purpureum]|uniref:CAP-Gly domain-containing protein n=1 Tax=Dictyostelium purpureum TaxID=5786 RepID=F0ZKQ5_DICPU|nr:uncharacterized protein DICPUDRAFT_94545 [Dictyostelium purpureum]EGC35470.1 hypothetical protein DICPUDRAFT_94545 [Dictyostelium purpureum]|eukprot:XP_003288013.1 hypothetical protein DICPUDRAFT_94545 [Dictyostelium purpureum]